MTESFDHILLSWLDTTPSMARRERQALLLKELIAVHTMRSLTPDAETDDATATLRDSKATHGDSAQRTALEATETTLCAALRKTLVEVVDVAEARRVAEALTVSTDLDVLYSALDLHCIMTLRLAGDGVGPQQSEYVRGVDAIINELSEFQEAVLLLRVDSSTSPSRSQQSAAASASSAAAAASSIVVRGVSEVQSWVARCAAEVEVGTEVTYYANSDGTAPLFELRSSFLFSADGAKVERVSRELLPRGGHHLSDLLRVLHFGSFQT